MLVAAIIAHRLKHIGAAVDLPIGHTAALAMRLPFPHTEGFKLVSAAVVEALVAKFSVP